MKKNEFDLSVHKRNAKGQIVRKEPYRLVVEAGQKKYERPPGSGFFYAEDGSLISQPKKAVEQKSHPSKNSEKEDIIKDIMNEVKKDGNHKD